MARTFAAVVTAAVAIGSGALYAQDPPRVTPIDAARLSAHIKRLAADDFEGRAPASAAEPKVIDYISKQMTAAGLKPGGDPDGNGGRLWTQDVPLVQADIDGAVTTTLTVAGASKALRQGDDIAVRATQLPTEHVSIQNAQLVFLGYGIHAPERKWDDFKGMDMHGKVGIVLINDPDVEADLKGRFDGKAIETAGSACSSTR